MLDRGPDVAFPMAAIPRGGIDPPLPSPASGRPSISPVRVSLGHAAAVTFTMPGRPGIGALPQ